MATEPSNFEGGISTKTQEIGNSTVGIEDLLSQPIESVFAGLETSSSGLTSEQAETNLRRYGYNELAKRKKKAAVVELLMHLRNPLIIILLFAGLVSGLLGDVIDTIIIVTIVLLSVGLDYFQESKALKAAELLKEKVAVTATVLRDGVKKEVKVSDIVPGDVVSLSAGDMIPADARIVAARDFFVNQSALTGESFPVEKTDAPPKNKNVSMTEWNNCVFLGTSVVSGTGSAIVLKTGSQTEYGKIAKKLVTRAPRTEYERGLRSFGVMMMELTFSLVILVFFINALFQRGVLESLLFAVALAVGLTPELLPMILSVNLSRGAIEMSKKDVIVKRLASIQNFGNMDVLCTDKTGTLTENRISLVLHIDIDRNDDEEVLAFSYVNSHFQTGLKSPLDSAILDHRNIDIADYRKIDEIPFDFNRKRVSVVVERRGRYLLISKGAPEEIVKVSSRCSCAKACITMDEELKKRVEDEYRELSAEGYRTLGIAYKEISNQRQTYSVADETDMVFLGFVAFIDPPKESARESLRRLKELGIEVRILTGDNELVTKRVCEQLDFEVKEIVLGSEISGMDDAALARVVEQANIFARVSPAQKDRIMNALKNNGHVVGFLGDGINDAPSMRTADVGVSVDNAVDVARASADIILLKKGLGVLADGVVEGRKTFGNTLKYIMMGTSSNFGNMLSLAGASLFLPFLPMLPIQILLNNLLYDLSESTIPTDNVDPEYVLRPRKLDIKFIQRFMILLGPVSTVFDFLTFILLFAVFNASIPLFRTGWFMESMLTQTLVVFVIRTRKVPFYRSKASKPLILSTICIAGLALVIPFTPLGDLFQFVSPPLLFFLLLAILTVSYLIVVEFVKRWFFRAYAY
jgi:P-type Mg2+ transporter